MRISSNVIYVWVRFSNHLINLLFPLFKMHESIKKIFFVVKSVNFVYFHFAHVSTGRKPSHQDEMEKLELFGCIHWKYESKLENTFLKSISCLLAFEGIKGFLGIYLYFTYIVIIFTVRGSYRHWENVK